VALIGLGDDLGVRLNHGRPGAAEGPRAFRDALAKYGVAEPGWEWPVVFDAGDIVPASGDSEATLHDTHWRVTEAVGALLDLGLFPIAVGGGHDLTFGFVRAVAQRTGRGMAGIYFDAHLDVRETVGSGMPFRRLVEDCHVSALRVAGVNELANSGAHKAWFGAHGGVVLGEGARPRDVLGERPEAGRVEGGSYSVRGPELPGQAALFASFDLDVLDAAHAPGVSALNAAGWSVARAEEWVHAMGRERRVRCFDIMELNPAFDAEGRTARVAAHLFLTFLRGVAERDA
jgi:formiminoglutamase